MVCNLEYFVAIWNILWPFGIFYGHLEYFMAIWNILWPFGILGIWPFGKLVVIWYIFPVLVHCIEKNLAALRGRTTTSLMPDLAAALPRAVYGAQPCDDSCRKGKETSRGLT
jgi:hypothetical protein